MKRRENVANIYSPGLVARLMKVRQPEKKQVSKNSLFRVT